MKDKLFKTIGAQKREAREEKLTMSAKSGALRRGWRFSWRVLSLALVLSILFNSVCFGADKSKVQFARAYGDGLSTYSVDPEMREHELEIGGDSKSYSADPSENVLEYHFDQEKTVLLSEIFASYELPILMQDVDSLALLGGGDVLDPYMLLSVEPVLDDLGNTVDYSITAIDNFDEVLLSVPVPLLKTEYTLALSNPMGMAIDADMGESDEMDMDDDDADPGDSEARHYTFDLCGESQIWLSGILNVLGNPVGLGEVDGVLLPGGLGSEGKVSVEALDGDYRITVLEDFAEAHLSIHTVNGFFCTLALLNGREAVEEPAAPQPEEDADLFSPSILQTVFL